MFKWGRRTKCLFAVGALLAPCFRAEAAPARFSDFVLEALEKAPATTSARDLVGASESDRVRRFFPNNPQLQVSDADDHASQSYAASLTVGFPGKAFALAKVDSAKLATQNSELSARKHEVARLIGQSYFECAGQMALRQIQGESMRDLSDVSETLRALYEAGRATQAERIGADLQVRQARADLQTAKDRAVVSCRYLSELLSLHKVDAHLAAEPELELPSDIDAILLQALAPESADEARGLAQIRLSEATSRSAGWSLAPDLTFAIARNHYFGPALSPLGAEWTSTYSVGISLPLFFAVNERVDFKRLRAQAVSDQAQAQALIAKARSDVEDAGFEYRRNRTRLKEIEEKDLGLAQALVESTAAAYRSGKLGFAELLFSRKTLSDLRVQSIQLKVNLLNARLRCLSRCES